jgi:F-type H+-transporting ATPase subunit delta
MKKSKKLLNLVRKMVADSYKDGRLLDSKVKSYTAQIKKFNLPQAIFILKEYIKELKRVQSEKTLIIETATPLSSLQVNKIKSEFGKDNQIVETNVIINPTLLGGLRVRLGDIIYDDTITAKITQIGGAIANG